MHALAATNVTLQTKDAIADLNLHYGTHAYCEQTYNMHTAQGGPHQRSHGIFYS